jgi:MSHA biogenesis protein MshN
LLSEHPDFKPARTTLAAMLVKYGDSAQALTVLNAGLKQSPADKDMAELTAHILVEQGSVQQALRILKRAQPATIQSDPDYYALMAGLYIQEKDFLQAQNFYQALTRLNPQNGNWWAGLAISSEKLGLQQAAMDAYNRAETVGGLSPALQAYIEQTMQGS